MLFSRLKERNNGASIVVLLFSRFFGLLKILITFDWKVLMDALLVHDTRPIVIEVASEVLLSFQ